MVLSNSIPWYFENIHREIIKYCLKKAIRSGIRNIPSSVYLFEIININDI